MTVGYSDWLPTDAETRQLLDDAIEVFGIYERQLPLTSRQVYYRLKALPQWQEWMEQKAKAAKRKNRSLSWEEAQKRAETSFLRKVYHLLEEARRSRKVPEIAFENMRDDGYVSKRHRCYLGTADFYGSLQDAAARYRLDLLENQPNEIRVHVEAAGMLPQVGSVCSAYTIPYASCGGFDSVQGKWEAAQRCVREFERTGRPTVVLHLGDLNAHGLSIYETIRDEMLAFIEEDLPGEEPEEVVIFERIALLEDQVPEVGKMAFEPPSANSKNHREKSWQLDYTCELDALDPSVMQDILRESIEAHLDLEQLELDRRQSQQERDEVMDAISELERGD